MNLPLALTRRGLGFLLGSLGLWAGWWIVGLRDIWYLVALLAAFLVVALVSALLFARRSRPEVRVSVTDPTPSVGESVTLTARVRYGSSSASRVELVWEIDGERLSTALSPTHGEFAIASIDWRATARGPVAARIVRLGIVDPLGLVRWRASGDARYGAAATSASLLVLPRPLETLADLLEDEGGDGSDSTANRPRAVLGAGTPGGSVREYRSGDAPREIHWKQSARQGELLVNLQEQSDPSEFSVLLCAEPEAYDSDTEFELAVSATAALGLHALEAGHAVWLHLGDEPPVSCGDAGELLRALALASLQPLAQRSARGGSGTGTRNSTSGAARFVAGSGSNTGSRNSTSGADRFVAGSVVTGTITPALAERLRREEGRGTVYMLQLEAEAAPPAQWRTMTVPLIPQGSRP